MPLTSGMNKYVHVVLYPTQKDQLDKLKVVEEETYYKVIGRLIDFYIQQRGAGMK